MSAFARRYTRNRSRFLFLRLLRCFTSAGVALCSRRVKGVLPQGVTPFGNPRVNAPLPLTVAYRSLARPSSPAGTKASIMRSSLAPTPLLRGRWPSTCSHPSPPLPFRPASFPPVHPQPVSLALRSSSRKSPPQTSTTGQDQPALKGHGYSPVAPTAAPTAAFYFLGM